MLYSCDLTAFLPRRGSNNQTGKSHKIRGSLEKDNSFILTGILIDNTVVYLTETFLASQNVKFGLVKGSKHCSTHSLLYKNV